MDIDLKERGFPLPKDGEVRGPIFRKSDNPQGGFDFHNHMMPYGSLILPRPIILEMLQSKIGSMCTVHTSKNMKSYSVLESGIISLQFADGTTAEANVLIGSDGVHSATRRAMFTHMANKFSNPEKMLSYIDPVWSGTICYRAMVSVDRVKMINPKHQALIQPKIVRQFKCYIDFLEVPNIIQCSGAGKINAFNGPWVVDVDAQEVVSCYENWEPDLVSLLEHAMTPHQGLGGGQAIEDAYILGNLLAHQATHLENVSEVMKIYQNVRLSMANLAAETSRRNGLMYDFLDPDYPTPLDASMAQLEQLGKAIGDSFAWLGVGGCINDWKRAEQMLHYAIE
ncbi:Salicylate hydroxylase [Leucoagaricus sp. SymC.cos]|nr:Salicylate hydroxylase [Leucoagaricus sp. SymC.cos]